MEVVSCLEWTVRGLILSPDICMESLNLDYWQKDLGSQIADAVVGMLGRALLWGSRAPFESFPEVSSLLFFLFFSIFFSEVSSKQVPGRSSRVGGLWRQWLISGFWKGPPFASSGDFSFLA